MAREWGMSGVFYPSYPIQIPFKVGQLMSGVGFLAVSRSHHQVDSMQLVLWAATGGVYFSVEIAQDFHELHRYP